MNRPPTALLLSWAGLLALLALTVVLAYQPLGRLNTVVALAIASLKVLIIAAIFMELREQRPLVFAFAAAGLFWLAILLWLGSIDFFTRPEFPPSQHMGTTRDPSRGAVVAAFRNGQRPEQVLERGVEISVFDSGKDITWLIPATAKSGTSALHFGAS